MKKLLTSGVIVGLVMVSVLAVGIAATGTVLAQEGTNPTPEATAPLGGRGGGHGRGGYGQVELEAIAKALGMTADELSTQLWGGSTVADLAEKAGVELAGVQKAAQDAQLAAMKESIKQAVTDGKITQEQADWMIEGLDKGYVGKHGFGFGFGGCGGRGGMKGSRGSGTFGGTRYTPSTSGSTDF